MKIGLLSYRSHPYSGGQGIYIKHLSRALSKLGNDVSVISGPPYPDLDDSVRLIKIPSLDLFASEDRLREFKLRYLLNPLYFYEWITVMTGGFPEPYTRSAAGSFVLADFENHCSCTRRGGKEGVGVHGRVDVRDPRVRGRHRRLHELHLRVQRVLGQLGLGARVGRGRRLLRGLARGHERGRRQRRQARVSPRGETVRELWHVRPGWRRNVGHGQGQH